MEEGTGGVAGCGHEPHSSCLL